MGELALSQQQYQQFGQSQSYVSISQMIAMLDVQSLLIDAPTTSVSQTIDVDRLEDEIVSLSGAAASGSPAITLGVGSTEHITSAIDSDYDTVSEQVRRLLSASK